MDPFCGEAFFWITFPCFSRIKMIFHWQLQINRLRYSEYFWPWLSESIVPTIPIWRTKQISISWMQKIHKFTFVTWFINNTVRTTRYSKRILIGWPKEELCTLLNHFGSIFGTINKIFGVKKHQKILVRIIYLER